VSGRIYLLHLRLPQESSGHHLSCTKLTRKHLLTPLTLILSAHCRASQVSKVLVPIWLSSSPATKVMQIALKLLSAMINSQKWLLQEIVMKGKAIIAIRIKLLGIIIR